MSPNPIPQTDPRAGYLARRKAIDEAIARTLESGWYILGAEVSSFEVEFAAYIGGRHCVGVGSGTDALVLALRAAGVRPGDFVATVSHTAVATVAAIELAGAKPLLVDIDPKTYTIDPEKLSQVLSSPPGRISAVIAVHLYGQPADLAALVPLVAKHGVRLIEDCAQSHGAYFGDRRAGTFGDIACFSFYPTKNLGALGDGGAVVTSDDGIAERLRALREYGWKERYISDIPGTNSRLDELQAAILRAKLPALDLENTRRAEIADAYDKGLQGLALTLPYRRAGTSHVFHQYVVRSGKREALRMALKQEGVATNIHYPVPVHRQAAYEGRIAVAPSGMAETERAALEVLSLPMYPQLDDAQVDRVVAALRKTSFS